MWEKLWQLSWGKNVKTVKNPNLPEMAEAVIIGEKYSSLLTNPLKNQGIEPIFVPNNALVDPRLSGHADLSVLHRGGDRLWLAPHLRGSGFADRLSAMGFVLDYPDMQQSDAYPADAQLNLCFCGQFVICNPNVIPSEIVDYLTISEYKIVNCRQGYARCSICVVDEGAIITADRGIGDAAKRAGMDILLIEPGYIALEGFSSGFIGGAAFKISQSKLAFTGKLDGHKNKNEVFDFLKCHGIEPIFLTEMPVFDIGSGIPILEK